MFFGFAMAVLGPVMRCQRTAAACVGNLCRGRAGDRSRSAARGACDSRAARGAATAFAISLVAGPLSRPGQRGRPGPSRPPRGGRCPWPRAAPTPSATAEVLLFLTKHGGARRRDGPCAAGSAGAHASTGARDSDQRPGAHRLSVSRISRRARDGRSGLRAAHPNQGLADAAHVVGPVLHGREPRPAGRVCEGDDRLDRPIPARQLARELSVPRSDRSSRSTRSSCSETYPEGLERVKDRSSRLPFEVRCLHATGPNRSDQ